MSFFLNTTVCGFSLYHILAFFLIYSCLGWCVEVVYAAATTGQLVNRGFLNGPVCPIYGFGMILVLIFLTPLEDDLLLLPHPVVGLHRQALQHRRLCLP